MRYTWGVYFGSILWIACFRLAKSFVLGATCVRSCVRVCMQAHTSTGVHTYICARVRACCVCARTCVCAVYLQPLQLRRAVRPASSFFFHLFFPARLRLFFSARCGSFATNLQQVSFRQSLNVRRQGKDLKVRPKALRFGHWIKNQRRAAAFRPAVLQRPKKNSAVCQRGFSAPLFFITG